MEPQKALNYTEEEILLKSLPLQISRKITEL